MYHEIYVLAFLAIVLISVYSALTSPNPRLRLWGLACGVVAIAMVILQAVTSGRAADIVFGVSGMTVLLVLSRVVQVRHTKREKLQ